MESVAENGLENRRPDLRAFLARRWPGLLLSVILVAALALRLYGIDWDQGHLFHPDERSIYMRVMELEWPSSFSEFLSAEDSPLNPHWFPLGSILLYVLLLIKGAFSPLVDMGLYDLRFAGRTLAILADVASVYTVFALGRKLYGRKVGLLAAGLLALTVTCIQHSHFYRPEPFIVLFVLASIWFMLRLTERRSLKDAALLGLFVGLAFAVKVSVLPLLVPLAVGFGIRVFRTGEGTMSRPSPRRVGRVALEALVAAMVAGAVFLLWTPYAIIDLPQLIKDLLWEAKIARVAGEMPYTVQYLGTPRYWYELQQTAVWGMGLPLGLVAWGGLLFTLARLRRPSRGDALLLAWVVPNFLLVGSFEVKFLRYVFPIVPFLVLMGSNLMVLGVARVRRWRPRATPWAMGAAAFVVVATAFYALAFQGMYSRPHPAVQASRWIKANIPFNARIVSDNHWDEGIPDMGWYPVEQLPMFEGDKAAKMKRVARDLERGDYLVFYGKLTYGSIARANEKFPLSSRYYEALFAGDLGYEPVRAFTSYPELFEVAFVDDTFTRAGLREPEVFKDRSAALSFNLGYADNDVVKYDHPRALLFENTGHLSYEELRGLLTGRVREEPAALAMMLTPEELQAQREGGTWSEIIRVSGWANRFPALSWLLMVELVSLAALPLAYFLLRRLPDGGLLWARPLGILGVSYVAWLLASLKLMAFTRFSVLAGLLVVGFLSSAVLAFRWRELADFLRRRWRLALLGEVLFLAAFLSFMAIRMANPDLWHPFRGGEKPMEFAYLNAVVRSTYMPPYDPWFAGGYMNYYYWGYFVVAALVKALGMVPAVAYNLAVPLFFALTVTGAFSLVYNITEGLRRRRTILKAARPPTTLGLAGRVEPPPSTPLAIADTPVAAPFPPPSGEGPGPPGEASRRTGPRWGPIVAGLMAAVLVAVIGNLDGIVQLIQPYTPWREGGLSSFDYWRSSRMIPEMENVAPSVFRFWLPPTPRAGPDVAYHITEFPFFTFLFADLHAHLMAIPFALLTLGLSLALLLELKRDGGRRLLPLVAVLALALGAIATINSWDYPTYIVLTVVVIACGVWLKPGRRLSRWGLFLVLVAGAVGLSFLAFLPFHLRNEASGVGLDVSKWATPIYSYIGMFGLFLFVTVVFLVHNRRAVLSLLRGKDWLILMVLVAVLALAWLALAGYWTAVLVGILLVPTALLVLSTLRNREEGTLYVLFPLLLLAMALLISGGVEFVRMKDDIGRMNTLFKLYLEVWVFFAVTAAFAFWYLAARMRWPRSTGAWIRRVAWLGLLAALLGSSLIYTVAGTHARVKDRFNVLPLTLDGTAYMEQATYHQDSTPIQLKWDLAAIRWLQENVQGSPVVLEGRTTQYQWGSRISIYTGLPAILGWHWHQTQQRPGYSYAVDGRQAIVDAIYSTSNQRHALERMEEYDVEYVVVGELERIRYPEEGLAKFDAMVGEEMELVYENGPVKIYRVVRGLSRPRTNAGRSRKSSAWRPCLAAPRWPLSPVGLPGAPRNRRGRRTGPGPAWPGATLSWSG